MLALIDEASETELDDDANLCQAVRVGVRDGNKVRPLCERGCRDAAEKVPTILLREDAQVSDIPLPSDGTHGVVRLCGHHAGMYVKARMQSKCSVAVCYREATQAKDGVLYCAHHILDENRREPSSQRTEPRRRSNSWGLRAWFRGRGRSRTPPATPRQGATKPDTSGPAVDEEKHCFVARAHLDGDRWCILLCVPQRRGTGDFYHVLPLDQALGNLASDASVQFWVPR
ncbi:MAG: hypothetical protein ACPIOQ_84945, partial [Promethearchaeia archaeon]